MQELNFKRYPFRIKNKENKLFLFDLVRKKFIRLTPEEWVRQHVVWYLHYELNYPLSLINVEKEILLHHTKKRYDIVVFDKKGNIQLIVECKAPQIKISQETFDQIARYNLELQSAYLMVTNGLDHYYCTMDYSQEKYVFLKEIPTYSP
ncbi:type I restriction enzyme HsdR N-terminal domain-containing protein [Flavimarina sp. Hel_I_48]|uniref:type I restriction enzyme HsdR N-terminal domain-containing protein n=1 Tax=Flavimarina sp. Hel_I_48 TaxID=1392488 RepID=UPI0004DF1F89|nr:type I restriction enzyme HsdR N-terminal domain-containing protein [Flavimarina sp. Hel_I_48]